MKFQNAATLFELEIRNFAFNFRIWTGGAAVDEGSPAPGYAAENASHPGIRKSWRGFLERIVWDGPGGNICIFALPVCCQFLSVQPRPLLTQSI